MCTIYYELNIYNVKNPTQNKKKEINKTKTKGKIINNRINQPWIY